MKTEFDYGDLEKVAAKVMELVYEHTDVTFEPSWNRSRILTEAIQSVAFPD